MASAPVAKATIELVRASFLAKRDVIVSHSKPWTPWALAHLLEIDDTTTTLPAELIIYKVLKASAPNRIAIRDAIVQVKINK